MRKKVMYIFTFSLCGVLGAPPASVAYRAEMQPAHVQPPKKPSRWESFKKTVSSWFQARANQGAPAGQVTQKIQVAPAKSEHRAVPKMHDAAWVSDSAHQELDSAASSPRFLSSKMASRDLLLPPHMKERLDKLRIEQKGGIPALKWEKLSVKNDPQKSAEIDKKIADRRAALARNQNELLQDLKKEKKSLESGPQTSEHASKLAGVNAAIKELESAS